MDDITMSWPCCFGDYRRELAMIPGITSEQAKRCAAKLGLELRKAEAKAEKAAKVAPVRVRLDQLSTVGRLALHEWRR